PSLRAVGVQVRFGGLGRGDQKQRAVFLKIGARPSPPSPPSPRTQNGDANTGGGDANDEVGTQTGTQIELGDAGDAKTLTSANAEFATVPNGRMGWLNRYPDGWALVGADGCGLTNDQGESPWPVKDEAAARAWAKVYGVEVVS